VRDGLVEMVCAWCWSNGQNRNSALTWYARGFWNDPRVVAAPKAARAAAHAAVESLLHHNVLVAPTLAC
jgi:hypothetical protein